MARGAPRPAGEGSGGKGASEKRAGARASAGPDSWYRLVSIGGVGHGLSHSIRRNDRHRRPVAAAMQIPQPVQALDDEARSVSSHPSRRPLAW